MYVKYTCVAGAVSSHPKLHAMTLFEDMRYLYGAFFVNIVYENNIITSYLQGNKDLRTRNEEKWTMYIFNTQHVSTSYKYRKIYV